MTDYCWKYDNAKEKKTKTMVSQDCTILASKQWQAKYIGKEHFKNECLRTKYTTNTHCKFKATVFNDDGKKHRKSYEIFKFVFLFF